MNPDRVRSKPGQALVAVTMALSLLTGCTIAWGAPGRTPVSRQQLVAEDPQKARVIVRFKSQSALLRSPRVGPQHAATLAGRTGLRLRNGRMLDAQSQVVHGQGLSSTQLRQRLLTDPDVESVAVDQRRWALAAAPVVNDPLFGPQNPAGGVTPLVGQWYLQAPDAVVVSAINAVGAWALTTGSSNITVAVVDTGVRFDHPDLVGKFFPGPAGANYGYGHDFVSVTSISVDGDAADDDASDPGTWGTAAQCDGTAEVSNWHGTMVSGLIGAQTNNGVGMASVGRNVMLLPVRALGQCGSGYDSDIVAAMKWAGGINVPGAPTNLHPAQVINLSLGGVDNSAGTSCASNGYTAAVAQLNAKGVVVVAAAGNDEGLAVGVPAKCPGVIGVAGVRHIGTKVGFSNIGPELTIAAPGGNCVNLKGPCLYPILTTSNTGTTAPTVPSTNAYTDSDNSSVGTSFSAPLVAATVALMQSVSPLITPAQVKAALQATARSFPNSCAPVDIRTSLPIVACRAPSSAAQDECYCTTSTCGAGLLDSSAAVARAAGAPVPTPNIVASATTVELGATVAVDGSTSTAGSGRTLTGFQWWIMGCGDLATISSATNASSAHLTTLGGGSFTVNLTVTDSVGLQSTKGVAITVLAPAAPSVHISAAPATPTAGQVVSMDSAGTTVMATRTIASYLWAINSASGVAMISGSTSGATVTVNTSSAGTFTVTLTVTDSGGLQASTSQVVTVAVAPPPSSGGGGMDGRWLLGLALAVVALRASAAVTKRKESPETRVGLRDWARSC
jgi:serine protease